MRREKLCQSIINESPEQLLCIFLKEKYISNPAVLGLEDFSVQEAVEKSFEMTGDNFYCLYEKVYRAVASDIFINVKIYFRSGEFVSNGIDLSGGRITTCLSNFCKLQKSMGLVNSVELLLDESLNHGSLIINGFLDVRFKKSKRGRKGKFLLAGMSTDHENFSSEAVGNINTRAARVMKDFFSFQCAIKKFKENTAIMDLAMCVAKNFPRAIHLIEGE